MSYCLSCNIELNKHLFPSIKNDNYDFLVLIRFVHVCPDYKLSDKKACRLCGVDYSEILKSNMADSINKILK
jgi:hypothetical protein